MCKLSKNGLWRIDPCIANFIEILNINLNKSIKILACCCGHGKYPMTIIVEVESDFHSPEIYDLVSGIEIPRKKRFYLKDKQGYYYIPETLDEKRNS